MKCIMVYKLQCLFLNNSNNHHSTTTWSTPLTHVDLVDAIINKRALNNDGLNQDSLGEDAR